MTQRPTEEIAISICPDGDEHTHHHLGMCCNSCFQIKEALDQERAEVDALKAALRKAGEIIKTILKRCEHSPYCAYIHSIRHREEYRLVCDCGVHNADAFISNDPTLKRVMEEGK